MAQNLQITVGPVALTATLTTNIFNPAAAGSGTGYTPTASYFICHALHIVNKTTLTHNFTLYKGLTGANTAGTELWVAKVVPANDAFDWYEDIKFASTDFLVGGADLVTTLVLTMTGEIGLA